MQARRKNPQEMGNRVPGAISVAGKRDWGRWSEKKAEPPAASKEVDELVCLLQACGRAVPSLLSWSHINAGWIALTSVGQR